jgi:hypothetical protein
VSARTLFLISHAHTGDHWAGALFQDLSQRVAELVGAGVGEPVGFIDELIDPSADWNEELAAAIAATHVFVPLYSPAYLGNAWPMRERATFARRLERARLGADRARMHLVPVLWTPIPPWENFPDRGATLNLGNGVPEYAENGLRALCMLRSYRRDYATIVDRLAHIIARVVAETPLPGSPPMPIETSATTIATGRTLTLAVLAGVDGPEDWRPCSARPTLSITAEAAATVERMGMAAVVLDIHTAPPRLGLEPTIVLIDPWVAAGRDDLLTAVGHSLQPWVTPVLVLDRHDPRGAERGAEALSKVHDKLLAAGAGPVGQLLDVQEVRTLMPGFVAQTRRQYLSKGPAFAPMRPFSGRFRLTGGGDWSPPGAEAQR